MTLRQLIARCRTMASDNAKPPFWSDQQWADALNDAVSEACVRGDLLTDDQVTANFTAGYEYVSIPSFCYSVRRVSINGARLHQTTKMQLDRKFGNSWQSSTGTPSDCYLVQNKLRLHPIPDTSGTANMVAYITPKDSDVMDLQDAADVSPAVPDRMHTDLIWWALHLFFSVPDADVFNAGFSDRYDARFSAAFGPRRSEQEMQRIALKVSRESRAEFF